MPERNSNLLLSGVPVNGLQRGRVIQWYGGNLSIATTGVFDGASVSVMASTRFPAGGDRTVMADTAKYPDSDFALLDKVSGSGRLSFGNVNPCMLIVLVEGATANTNLRVAVA